MNLYFMIAVVAALGASHWFAYDTGKDVQKASQLELQAVAKQAAEGVRDEINGISRQLGQEVHAAVKNIRVTNQTSVQNIYKEKEIHRVLSDPDCAYPVSTLRVRNESRLDPDPDRRARQLPDAGMRKPSPVASGKEPPAR